MCSYFERLLAILSYSKLFWLIFTQIDPIWPNFTHFGHPLIDLYASPSHLEPFGAIYNNLEQFAGMLSYFNEIDKIGPNLDHP